MPEPTTKTRKRTPKPKAEAEKAPRKQRTAEERIADLKAEIERVEQREAEKALRNDPAIQQTKTAVRAINKALADAQDDDLVEALNGAKGALAGYLEGKGLRVPRPGKKRDKGARAA